MRKNCISSLPLCSPSFVGNYRLFRLNLSSLDDFNQFCLEFSEMLKYLERFKSYWINTHFSAVIFYEDNDWKGDKIVWFTRLMIGNNLLSTFFNIFVVAQIQRLVIDYCYDCISLSLTLFRLKHLLDVFTFTRTFRIYIYTWLYIYIYIYIIVIV